MSGEIQVRAGLIVKKGSKPAMQYQATFLGDQAGAGGPSPGEIVINKDGREVYFTELTTPGWSWIQNMEDPLLSDTYISFGMYDPVLRTYDPIGELGPGEGIPFKFSRLLMKRYTGSGTGTPTTGKYLRFEAHGSTPARVFLGAFQK